MRTRKQAQSATADVREAISDATAQAQHTQQLSEAQGKVLGDVKAQIEEYWED